MIYDELIEQYNNLSEEEKNILLVYKSKLGIAINSLDNNEEEIKLIYEQYKKLVNEPQNLFMLYSVFKDISFDCLENFKTSLRKISDKLSIVTNKITLPCDITTYRIVSIKEDDNLIPISKKDIISTSLDINECSKFMILDDDNIYNYYLYQINLPKSSPVAICPYSILLNSKTNQLVLSNHLDQKEIILSKENYNFEEDLTNSIDILNNKNLNIVIINAKIKDNSNYNNKRI